MSKIVNLQIKGFLGIKEIEFKPGKINYIMGKNGAGKTSILEAIEKVLSNNDRRTRVINEKSDKAEILVELDNGLEVSRNITEKNSYLTVKKDGFTQKAPQTLLNNLFGSFSFNPIDFVKEKPKRQAEILLELIDIKVDETTAKNWLGNESLPLIDFSQHGLKVIEELYKEFYEKRRDVNSEYKVLQGEYTTEINKVPNSFDPEEYRKVSLKDKYGQLQKAQQHNQSIESSTQFLKNLSMKAENLIDKKERIEEKAESEIQNLLNQIENIKENRDKQLAEMENEIDALNEKKEKGQEFLNNSELIDTSRLEKEVEDFEEKKELVGTYDRAQDKKKEMEEKGQESDRLDNIVNLLKAKPKELIESANLPIEGLTVENNIVLIHSRPIKDLSTGEKLKNALEIARKAAGPLKLINIDGIEILDPENRKLFLKEIENDEFQYFVTQATDDEELKIEARQGERYIDPLTGEIIEGEAI